MTWNISDFLGQHRPPLTYNPLPRHRLTHNLLSYIPPPPTPSSFSTLAENVTAALRFPLPLNISYLTASRINNFEKMCHPLILLLLREHLKQ